MMGRFLQNLCRIFLVLLLATIGAGSAGGTPSNWSQTELSILQPSILTGNTDPTNAAPTDLTKALALSGKNVGATDGLITDSGNFRALDGTKVLSASLNFLHSSNAPNGGFKPIGDKQLDYDVGSKTYLGVDNVELEIVGNPTKFTRAELTGRYSGRDLRIDFYKTDILGKGYGSELVSTAIETISPSKVKTVSGDFGLTNKSVFNDLVSSGSSAGDAAWGTPLGKTMKQLGFTKVEVGSGNNPSIKFGF